PHSRILLPQRGVTPSRGKSRTAPCRCRRWACSRARSRRRHWRSVVRMRLGGLLARAGRSDWRVGPRGGFNSDARCEGLGDVLCEFHGGFPAPGLFPSPETPALISNATGGTAQRPRQDPRETCLEASATPCAPRNLPSL